MRGRVAIALTLAAVLPALGVMAQPLPSDHLIVPGVRIGSAELEPADQGSLTRQLGEPNRTQRHGDHEIYLYGAGPEPDELVVDFDLANDAPFEISTASPLYHTQKGLAVGSAEDAVRDALGRPLCQAHDERGQGLLVYDSIWFLIAGGKVSKISIRPHLTAADFRTGPLHC